MIRTIIAKLRRLFVRFDNWALDHQCPVQNRDCRADRKCDFCLRYDGAWKK